MNPTTTKLVRHFLEIVKESGYWRVCRYSTVSVQSFSAPPSLSSSSATINAHRDTEAPKELDMLKDVRKMRINQLKLTRIGSKPAKRECIREFEVVNTLTSEKLLFVKLYHSVKLERYKLQVFPFNEGENPSGKLLMSSELERSRSLKTIACRVNSHEGTPISYIYDLDGVRRTAIVENGTRDKCLFQLLTRNQLGWSEYARIYNSKGSLRLGHIARIPDCSRHELMIYLRLYQGLDVQSKCVFILTAVFLMGFDYVR